MTTVHWGDASAVGLLRRDNEDAVFAQQPIFVVADGVGGQAAGGEASRLAVEQFERLATIGRLDSATVQATLARANESIINAARANTAWAGMGTTLVGLALVEDHGEPYWLLFNIGDSRAYRLADGRLEQLTTDHAIGNELTRALGVVAGMDADYWLLAPTPGERFLLCSDGLTKELADDALQHGLAAPDLPEVVARELVAAAVHAGGRDNVSAVVVEVLT